MNDIIAKEKLKGLNSLRFFAFFSIFLFHSFDSFRIGYLGVDFFFVLSSFLLTYLAFKEIERNTNFSQKNFFIRRILRIFPIYFLVIILLILILPPIAKHFNQDIQLPEKPYLYFVFLSNLDKSDHLFALKLLWSIAVEEQFYVLFLLLSLFFRKYFWVPISLLIIIYLGYLQASKTITLDTYLQLAPHLINFAFGMILGYLFYKKKTNIKIAILMFCIGLIGSYITYENGIIFPIVFSLLMACIIIIMIELFSKQENIMTNVLYLPEKLGVYTYGLYVYSGIVISFSKKLLPIENSMIQFIINFIIVIVLAIVSYHLLEKRFIEMKDKYYTI